MREWGDGGPSSATFEHANAFVTFIQRFGTRLSKLTPGVLNTKLRSVD
jgi:hypothetical protein